MASKAKIGANEITISHPKANKIGFRRFVVHGLSGPNIEFIVGRLTDKASQKIYQGKTIFFPPKWGVYFTAVPDGKYTLGIIGLSVDVQTGMITPYSVSKDLEVATKGRDIQILWPSDGESACRDNFAPYGTYNPAGTVMVSLRTPGQSMDPDNVYTDPPNQFWSAQFSLAQDTKGDALTAANSMGGVDTRLNLTLDEASC